MSNENPYSSPEQLGMPVIGKKPPMFSWLGCGLMVVIAIVLIGLLMPANRGIRPAARRAQCQNNLKQIALALHNYESRHGSLPPAYTVDADGKPLHSWRTFLLPYLEQKTVFDSIDFSKPWDDPVNAKAFETPLSCFSCPMSYDSENQNHTTYVVVVAPNSCFRAGDPVRLMEITDGQSETLLVIEVHREQSVPWMSPQNADPQMLLDLFSDARTPHQGINVAFADGSVIFQDKATNPDQIRAMISISGDDNESPGK